MERKNPASSSSLNREELLQMAMNTAKQNPGGAEFMFKRVLAEDPRNERALLWMAYLEKSDIAKKRRFLKKVLRVNPDNDVAKRELEKIATKNKAASNRTMFYGGVAITSMLLLVSLVIVVMFAISTMP